jgi:Protein kinase domain
MPARSAESVFAEWFARQGTDEATPFEKLLGDNPAHADRLNDLRSMQEELDRALRAAGLTGSLAERLKSLHGSEVDPRVELEHEEFGDFTETLLGRLSGRAPASGRYHLKGEVARGGMGAVLRVWDEDLRRHLAMKVLLGKGQAEPRGDTPPVDKRQLARFLEEAQVTGQLDHPGIVPVHELGLDAEGRVFFTMKLVKGRTLAEVFDELHRGEGDWTQARVLGLILKVCEAMSYAHAKGVIHRDLKPANVMVGRFGEVIFPRESGHPEEGL